MGESEQDSEKVEYKTNRKSSVIYLSECSN